MSEDTATDIGAFFDRMWKEDKGFVHIPRIEKETDTFKSVMLPWPSGRQMAIDYCLAQSAEGNDVYFSPAIYSAGKPIKENFASTRFLWADFDGDAPSAEDWDRGATGGLQGVPVPTLRVQTSTPGREHVYWELAEPCTDIEFLENTNRAIAYTLKADLGGWDAVQNLRPPGTYHYKDGPKPVAIVSDTKEPVALEGFTGLKSVKHLAMDALIITDVPDAAWVSAKYPWDAAHWEMFNQELTEGPRSDALMRLGYFGAESGMEDAEIYSLLLNADDRWGKYKKRADRERRLTEIIVRARLKYPVGSIMPDSIIANANGETIIENEKDVGITYGFQDFLDHEIYIEWAFEDLIDTTGLGILAAAPGVGKTQLSIQMGIAAATGKDFLGWKPTGPMKMVFFSLEMSHRSLSHFMRTIAKGYSAEELRLLQRNFIIVPLGQAISLDQPSGKAFVENIIREHKPKGIIIDSMGKVTTSALTDETLIKELNSYYSRLREEFKCFMWFIHHTRKASDNNKKPRELSDIYGNQYITTDATIVLNLWREKDSSLELSVIKNRLASDNVAAIPLTRDEHLKFNLLAKDIIDNPHLMAHVGKDSANDGPGGGTQQFKF